VGLKNKANKTTALQEEANVNREEGKKKEEGKRRNNPFRRMKRRKK